MERRTSDDGVIVIQTCLDRVTSKYCFVLGLLSIPSGMDGWMDWMCFLFEVKIVVILFVWWIIYSVRVTDE